MSAVNAEYVTKPELDVRLKGITDKQSHETERNAERQASMEKLIDNKLTVMQMLMEKNLAQYDSKVSELRAEMNDLRGDVKALNAKVDTMQTKLGFYVSLLGIGISVVLVIFQMLMK